MARDVVEREAVMLESGWRTLRRELSTDGWEYGVPHPDCWMDREVFTAGRHCARCGGPLAFWPLVRGTRRNPMSGLIERMGYRAFILCGACDACAEV